MDRLFSGSSAFERVATTSASGVVVVAM